MHSVLTQTPPVSPAASGSKLPAVFLFLALGFLWFILCRDLSLEWSSNEQYSYGWFVPVFAAFLFWLRWESFPNGWTTAVSSPDLNRSVAAPYERREPQSTVADRRYNKTAVLALLSSVFLLLLFPVRLFEIANPDWRPLSWLHALAVVGLTLLLIWSWRGKPALRHFAFPVCFILVAVPWLTPIEAPLVQWLMRVVATVATETLALFGIPAQLEGSLIRVDGGVVGVSEACSGVRSLQTSLMIGLLFGELKRLTIARRLLLVGAALVIALLANFARAIFLVWIAATQNLAAVERWHDLAGYAIIGAVFFGTFAIAMLLAGNSPSLPKSEAGGQKPAIRLRLAPITHHSSLITSGATLAYLLLVELAVEGWYRWHERNFVPTVAWSVRWPENAPGFRELPIPEIIRSTLRYDKGREASWHFALRPLPGEAASPGNCTMFFFRWEPGSASILRARAHRPDICLPSTGWRLTSDEGVRRYRASDDVALPFRHFRFARRAGGAQEIFAEAFFCQREDRVPPGKPDRFDATAGRTGNWEIADRLRVVRAGLRNQGQQVMELVLITPNEMANETAEAEFVRLVTKLVTSD